MVGLADSIYKLRPDGSLIWKQSMKGLDNYIIDAQIIYSNYLLVCGSIADTVTTGSTVNLYNLNGTVTWSANYRSNTQQDFPVSFAFGSDGIYVLADSISNTSLIKFESPFNSSTIDFDLFCVDSVWYDPSDPQFVNIRVVNGSLGGLNYPSVQMLSPTGDTISNPSNQVDFFVHVDNVALVYRDSILVQGITDFSDYSFLISEGFGDTTVAIGWCFTSGIDKLDPTSVILYPNPAENYLNLLFQNEAQKYVVDIVSQDGKVCIQKSLGSIRTENMDISTLASGVYFLRIRNSTDVVNLRFIKL
ncbi:MAG: T9SS type A sorting domain-containing protein [Bacteroidetes bacterium]|nr:T9SS type A sorting domain-containing protein [Bacteroidota bacterium]